MASKSFSFPKLVLSFSRLLLKYFKNRKFMQRNITNNPQKINLSDNQTLIFNMEDALLKSPSVFPYFMLVAFEGGSLIRAFFLFLLYPLIVLVNEEVGLNIMVMVCFLGIKKDGFRVGSAVLPKFFLEGVGVEGYAVVRRGGRRVGVSGLPRVMVECFLKDYLEVDFVVGRDLVVICGYFVGVMEKRKKIRDHLKAVFEDEKMCCNLIGITDSVKSVDRYWSSHCKEIYLVNEGDKKNWHPLPWERYPKPLIFHDGRLAFRPTPLATLAMFMWVPIGSILGIIRIIVGLSLPFSLATPMLACTGLQLKLTKPNYSKLDSKPNGILYVCNHRTLLDPLCVSLLLKKPLAAVTYSLSRISEFLAPIRTVRLRRDRDKDAVMMKKLLDQGDLVVCPEGTTCREPYLMRFSPLFSELSHDIVPIGMDTRVSMFYGTTASGLKCLDSLFFLMNPRPTYTARFLDTVRGVTTCDDDAKSKFDVANRVQREIGKALGFECTKLTRKDKYMILAGNEGIIDSR